jgi:tetratricopeptide (TPR) repeat protein
MRMKLRFPILIAVALLATPALAQSAQDDQQDWQRDDQQGWPSQPSGPLPPRVEHGGLTYNLDTLFGALKIVPDEASAKVIEDRIWALWTVSGSDTCNLLMSRVKAATEDKDYDLAIKLLDSVIALEPDYVEAWNRRATVYYLKQDYGHAIADIAAVLTREPRHFGALAGLGMMLQDIGDDKDALDAYRKALAIDPHLDNIPDVVKTLEVKVEGRDI